MMGRILRSGVLAVLLPGWGALAQGEAEGGRWAGQWMGEGAALAEVEAISEDGEEAADGAADADVLVEGGVPEFDVSSIFAELPGVFLVDAGELLSPVVAEERMDFLQHHAGDSMIDLYVYVLDPTWRVPEDVDVSRLFSGMDAAVVLYTMGEPQRAGLYLPGHLAEQVTDAEQRRSLQSSVMQASGKADADEQLEAFLVQMSIRLYWMERMIAGAVPTVEAPEIHLPELEVGPEVEVSPMQVPDGWILWMVAGAVVLVVVPIAWWLRFSRMRCRFPEFEVEPRLGGRHAAGVGAVISYLSPNVSPAVQRDQMPDYLRRM